MQVSPPKNSNGCNDEAAIRQLCSDWFAFCTCMQLFLCGWQELMTATRIADTLTSWGAPAVLVRMSCAVNPVLASSTLTIQVLASSTRTTQYLLQVLAQFKYLCGEVLASTACAVNPVLSFTRTMHLNPLSLALGTLSVNTCTCITLSWKLQYTQLLFPSSLLEAGTLTAS